MFEVVYDATHANIGSLPDKATYAGYVTGTSDVVWTDADFKAHPDAIRIDQTPVGTPWDALADGDDYERGAVTLGELPVRAKLRMHAFNSNARPGQRRPFVYASASNLTPVANALVAGGVTSGVGLWVAHWTGSFVDGINAVRTASGPFPIIGFQLENAGPFDVSVFATAYLTTRSGVPKPPVTVDGFVVYNHGVTGLTGKKITSTDDGNSWH
jgi:hypothetical protein